MIKREDLNKLVSLVKEKLSERSEKISYEEKSRLDEEVRFITLNYSVYEDLMLFLKAKENGKVGNKNKPNSFLFYILGITTKEPDLSKGFRFTHELDKDSSRVSPPDVDIDFEEREGVLDYLCEKYGDDHVALIGTSIAFKPKAAVQMVAKALDVTHTQRDGDKRFSSDNDQEAKRLSKLMPNIPGMDLKKWLGKDEEFKAPNNRITEAMDFLKKEQERYPEVFRHSENLEGKIKAYGTHAAGVVISRNPVVKDVPLHYTKVLRSDIAADSDFDLLSEEVKIKGRQIPSTQFDMKEVEEVGLLKFDLLQIETLRQIKLLVREIIPNSVYDGKINDLNKDLLTLNSDGKYALNFDIDDLEPNDNNVFKTIDDLKLEGVFQLSGDVFKSRYSQERNWETGELFFEEDGSPKMKYQKGLIEVIGCSSFNDIVASNAIGRPGPLKSRVHYEYARNKKNVDKIEYPHEKLEKILKPTYAILCVAEGSRIKTKKGIKNIENICNRDLVQTEDGSYQKVIERIYNGKKQTYKVRLSRGEEIIATPDHRVLTANGWKEIRDLNTKDIVKSFWDVDHEREDIGCVRDWVVGLLLADGDLCACTLNIACSDRDFAEKVCLIINNEFKITSTVKKYGRTWYACLSDKNDKYHNNKLKSYIEDLGLLKMNSYTKRLPKGSTLSTVAGFIEGDGCMANNRISIKNKLLAYDIYEILQQYKITSSIYEREKDVWSVIFYDYNNKIPLLIKKSIKYSSLEKTNNYVPRSYLPKLKRNNKYYQHMFKKVSYVSKKVVERCEGNIEHDLWSRVLSVKKHKIMNVYDLSVENIHSFVCGGHVVHNCYQEQLIEMAMSLAGFTFAQADKLRKACAKKDITILPEMEIIFREGCLKNKIPQNVIDEMWSTILKFGEYAFGLGHCISGDTLLFNKKTGEKKTIEDFYNSFGINDEIVLDSWVDGNIEDDVVLDIFETGEKDVLKITLSNGMEIKCTEDHKFLCDGGNFYKVKEIIEGDLKIISEVLFPLENKIYKNCKVLSAEKLGKQRTFNLTMKSSQHNYVIVDDCNRSVVSKNSTAYGYIAYQTAFLKTYFPTEFICAILSSKVSDDEKLGILRKSFKKEYEDLRILPPDINVSKNIYAPINYLEIVAPFSAVKGLGSKVSDSLISKQPYSSIYDFVLKCGSIGQNVVESLIEIGVFRSFGDKDFILSEYKRSQSIKKRVVKTSSGSGSPDFFTGSLF